MNKHLTGFRIQATGLRKASHPTSFHKIHLEVEITSLIITVTDLPKLTQPTKPGNPICTALVG